MKTPPPEQLKKMEAATLFGRVAVLLNEHPP